VNGDEGLSDDFDAGEWRLRVEGAGAPRALTIDDIRRLPRVEMTTELNASRAGASS
jgi:DMSO/TMAO reductase YedYZ molybdopterin-dependent catalytic subunit